MGGRLGAIVLASSLIAPAYGATQDVVNNLAEQCKTTGIEHVVMHDPTLNVTENIAETATRNRVDVNYEKAEAFVREHGTVEDHHCHPVKSREEFLVGLDAYVSKKLPAAVREKEKENLLKSAMMSTMFGHLSPSSTDIGAFVYYAGLFYIDHPEGTYRYFIITPRERDTHVLEVALQPEIEEKLRKSGRDYQQLIKEHPAYAKELRIVRARMIVAQAEAARDIYEAHRDNFEDKENAYYLKNSADQMLKEFIRETNCFSKSVRLYSHGETVKENPEFFGKCATPF